VNSIIRYLSWLFNFIIMSNLKYEIQDDEILVRGGNGVHFDPDSEEELIRVFKLEAAKLNAPVDISSNEFGVVVRIIHAED